MSDVSMIPDFYKTMFEKLALEYLIEQVGKRQNWSHKYLSPRKLTKGIYLINATVSDDWYKKDHTPHVVFVMNTVERKWRWFSSQDFGNLSPPYRTRREAMFQAVLKVSGRRHE